MPVDRLLRLMVGCFMGGWSRYRVLKAVTRSIGRGKASATVKGLMKAKLTRR